MNGYCFRRGDKLHYRSIGGDVYDCIQVGQPGPTGRIDIEIKPPGTQRPVRLSRVQVRHDDAQTG